MAKRKANKLDTSIHPVRKNREPVLLECSKCGWIHYAVARKEAERQVKEFNKYYHTLSKQKQRDFYGDSESHISSYEYCFFCSAHYKDIKNEPSKSIAGSTVQPIIHFEED